MCPGKLPMKRTARRLLSIAFAATILAGCGDDDPTTAPTPPADGSIQVVVRDQNSNPVAGATVRTNPQVGGGQTDAFGQVLLADVPAGLYTIVATHAASGSAQNVVQVAPSEL